MFNILLLDKEANEKQNVNLNVFVFTGQSVFCVETVDAKCHFHFFVDQNEHFYTFCLLYIQKYNSKQN